MHLYDMETKLNNTIQLETERYNPDLNNISMLNAQYQIELLSILNNGPSDRYYLSTKNYRCRNEDFDTIFYGDYMLIHTHIDFNSITFYDWSEQKQDIDTESFDKDVSNGCLRAITEEQFKHLATIRGLIKRVNPITVTTDLASVSKFYTAFAEASLKTLAELAKQQMTTLELMYSQECAAILECKSTETNFF